MGEWITYIQSGEKCCEFESKYKINQIKSSVYLILIRCVYLTKNNTYLSDHLNKKKLILSVSLCKLTRALSILNAKQAYICKKNQSNESQQTCLLIEFIDLIGNKHLNSDEHEIVHKFNGPSFDISHFTIDSQIPNEFYMLNIANMEYYIEQMMSPPWHFT